METIKNFNLRSNQRKTMIEEMKRRKKKNKKE